MTASRRKTTAEIVTVEGISYKIFRSKDGSSVQSPCSCFGSLVRCHSTFNCPWVAQRKKVLS